MQTNNMQRCVTALLPAAGRCPPAAVRPCPLLWRAGSPQTGQGSLWQSASHAPHPCTCTSTSSGSSSSQRGSSVTTAGRGAGPSRGSCMTRVDASALQQHCYSLIRCNTMPCTMPVSWQPKHTDAGSHAGEAAQGCCLLLLTWGPPLCQRCTVLSCQPAR